MRALAERRGMWRWGAERRGGEGAECNAVAHRVRADGGVRSTFSDEPDVTSG